MNMLSIKLPDGSVREVAPGATPAGPTEERG